jgi:hypothetical protein
MKKGVHIGEKIKAMVYEKRIPVVEFAQKINKSRTVVYHIFGRKSIDTELLIEISEVLDHNFFTHYFSEKMLFSEPETIYQTKSQEKIKKLEAELDLCKKANEILKKENNLLGKINSLLERKK